MITEFERLVHTLEIDGTPLRVAAITRGGARTPIVFLHGFGSTKEDYAEIPLCGHFPMYSNPLAMWQAIADFLGEE